MERQQGGDAELQLLDVDEPAELDVLHEILHVTITIVRDHEDDEQQGNEETEVEIHEVMDEHDYIDIDEDEDEVQDKLMVKNEEMDVMDEEMEDVAVGMLA